jgi:hypothetical protein
VVLSHYSGGREHKTWWNMRLLPVERSVPWPWGGRARFNDVASAEVLRRLRRCRSAAPPGRLFKSPPSSGTQAHTQTRTRTRKTREGTRRLQTAWLHSVRFGLLDSFLGECKGTTEGHLELRPPLKARDPGSSATK